MQSYETFEHVLFTLMNERIIAHINCDRSGIRHLTGDFETYIEWHSQRLGIVCMGWIYLLSVIHIYQAAFVANDINLNESWHVIPFVAVCRVLCISWMCDWERCRWWTKCFSFVVTNQDRSKNFKIERGWEHRTWTKCSPFVRMTGSKVS